MKQFNFLYNYLLILVISYHGVYGLNEISKIENETTKIAIIEDKILGININEKIDTQLATLKELLLSKGLDPMTLPNVDQNFEARPILFNHNGRIKLTKGWMEHLSVVQRDGDARLKPMLGPKQLIKFTLVLPQLDFGYKYSLKLGLLYHRWGKIKGNLQHFKAHFEVYYDLIKTYIQIKKVDIVDDGEINVKLTGNILTDGFYQKTVRKIAEELHKQLIEQIKQKINDSIDMINEKLKPKKKELLSLE